MELLKDKNYLQEVVPSNSRFPFAALCMALAVKSLSRTTAPSAPTEWPPFRLGRNDAATIGGMTLERSWEGGYWENSGMENGDNAEPVTGVG